MPPITPLFVLQIPTDLPTTTTKAPGGIICTSPSPKVYLVSFSSPPDNRLTPAFNNTLHLALDILEHRFPKGVVITTSSIQKFFSNGLDYDAAIKDPTFFSGSLFPLWRRFLTYPMPTIALLNGHAFAGGLMMAMMHDYRIMNPHKGFLCLNELDFGASLRPPMASIFRIKLPSPHTLRTLTLESKRFPALDALKEGIVDSLGGVEETLAFVDEMKLVQKAQSPTYGTIKEEVYRETVHDLEEFGGEGSRKVMARDGDREERKKASSQRVDEWELARGMQRAKL